MSDVQIPVTEPKAIDGPPPAAVPARIEADPRARLIELARELMTSRNRAAMWEYLRLRRGFKPAA